nr:7TM diverse intracellular signaling domain-containing protein [Spirochaetota bacterium]
MVDFLNALTMGILFSLFFHYFFVYLGRREEKINLYFGLFAFFCSLYIFFVSGLFLKMANITSPKTVDSVKSIVSAICSLSFIILGTESILTIFEYSGDRRIFSIIYFAHSILSAFIILAISFGGIIFYKKIFFFPVVFTSMALMFFVFIYLTYWIFKWKKIKSEAVLFVFIGLFVIVLNLVLLRIFNFYRFFNFINGNFIFIGFGLFLFSYFIAYKVNKEHYELKEKTVELESLTINLEKKISERTVELEKANNDINKIMSEKTISFINFAHETKTPLTLISNYLDKYIKKVNSNDYHLKVIKENIDRLYNDILNFFDIEKLERGEFLYENESITDFSSTLKDRIILFNELASKKDIKIIFDLEERIFIKADPVALERIINNLL